MGVPEWDWLVAELGSVFCACSNHSSGPVGHGPGGGFAEEQMVAGGVWCQLGGSSCAKKLDSYKVFGLLLPRGPPEARVHPTTG